MVAAVIAPKHVPIAVGCRLSSCVKGQVPSCGMRTLAAYPLAGRVRARAPAALRKRVPRTAEAWSGSRCSCSTAYPGAGRGGVPKPLINVRP